LDVHASDASADEGITGWGDMGIEVVGLGSNYKWFITDGNNQLHFHVVAVPEPEIYAMLGLGLGLIGWASRRRKQLH